MPAKGASHIGFSTETPPIFCGYPGRSGENVSSLFKSVSFIYYPETLYRKPLVDLSDHLGVHG